MPKIKIAFLPSKANEIRAYSKQIKSLLDNFDVTVNEHDIDEALDAISELKAVLEMIPIS